MVSGENSRVPHSQEPLHLRGTIQKFHVGIMPMSIIYQTGPGLIISGSGTVK